jgi:hypothetical protein
MPDPMPRRKRNPDTMSADGEIRSVLIWVERAGFVNIADRFARRSCRTSRLSIETASDHDCGSS